MLNQGTFFSVQEVHDVFETKSRIHIVYGDYNLTSESVDTEGLSVEDCEKIIKEKVKFGLGLQRRPVENDSDRETPIDIVQAREYVKHMDDTF
jgi:hypothetical protein